jgi:starch synthase (maltosyl-transferring)
VIFLAEAFTRPPMMHALAKIGFQQSYTYFTWRNTRPEIESYLVELSQETAAFFRPNFFVNTPDILHEFLQHGGPAAFRIRAALAATGSPTWGVYAGFELCERLAVRPGSEEYLDSEKYEVKVRDWAGAEAEGRSLAPYLRRLNEIRRAHPALRQLRDLTVHGSDDEHVLVFSKRARRDGEPDDVVVVVLNVDPHGAHETMVHLDLAALGLQPDDRFEVHDELTGQVWSWGTDNYVRLDPAGEVAHILTVRGPR